MLDLKAKHVNKRGHWCSDRSIPGKTDASLIILEYLRTENDAVGTIAIFFDNQLLYKMSQRYVHICCRLLSHEETKYFHFFLLIMIIICLWAGISYTNFI